jgi:hypothetical protein
VRRDRGELLGPDVRFETKHGPAAFVPGDRVQFTDTLKAARIYNGNVGTTHGPGCPGASAEPRTPRFRPWQSLPWRRPWFSLKLAIKGPVGDLYRVSASSFQVRLRGRKPALTSAGVMMILGVVLSGRQTLAGSWHPAWLGISAAFAIVDCLT